MGTKMMLL